MNASHAVVASVERPGSLRRSQRFVSAASLLVAACTSSVEPSSNSLTLQLVSATQFDGIVAAQVQPPPTVRVTDASGAPVRGVNLFAEITGGGWVVRHSLVTDDDGEARIDWTLGSRVGINTLSVRAPHTSAVVFTASAFHGPISYIQVMGDGRLVLPGTTFPEPLSARVQDAYGNPVPGATVTFTIASGGGTIDASTAVSDASGVARAGRWTLGPAGDQTVTVRAGAVETTLKAIVYVCSEPMPGSCAAPLELAFAHSDDGQIYRVRADGFGLTRLTTTGWNTAPAWAPDGRRIAFIHQAVGMRDFDVWVMDADGSNRTRRTADRSYGSVAWSPDGTRLAASSGGASAATYVFDADGAAVDQNEIVIPRSFRPTWSPDGRRIAYVKSNDYDYYGFEEIWVVNADGTGQRQLTPPGSSVYGRMAWSPDGLEVIYSDGGVVYAVKADGSGRREIVANAPVVGVDVSRDGNWLAVTTIDAAWVGYMPMGGGTPTLLALTGYDAVWRPR